MLLNLFKKIVNKTPQSFDVPEFYSAPLHPTGTKPTPIASIPTLEAQCLERAAPFPNPDPAVLELIANHKPNLNTSIHKNSLWHLTTTQEHTFQANDTSTSFLPGFRDLLGSSDVPLLVLSLPHRLDRRQSVHNVLQGFNFTFVDAISICNCR